MMSVLFHVLKWMMRGESAVRRKNLFLTYAVARNPTLEYTLKMVIFSKKLEVEKEKYIIFVQKKKFFKLRIILFRMTIA